MEDELATLLIKALSIADRLRNLEVGICLDQALCHLGRQPPVPPNDGPKEFGAGWDEDLRVQGLGDPRTGDEQ